MFAAQNGQLVAMKQARGVALDEFDTLDPSSLDQMVGSAREQVKERRVSVSQLRVISSSVQEK